MCDRQHADHCRVRLYRCEHGTYHLQVNGTTLHLLPSELALIGQAINAWARRHPGQVVTALDQLDQYLEN